MSPDQWRKARIYDTDYDDPDPQPLPFPDHGRIERRLAVLFALLAGLAIGAAIAWGMNQ